jgi:hypothetical protein
MFFTEGTSNYDKVLTELLAELQDKPLDEAAAKRLGCELLGGNVSVPFFKEPHLVKPDGIYRGAEKLDTVGSILVCRYLLIRGDDYRQNVWWPYRDLKGGEPFAEYVKANIEEKTAKAFSDKKDLLRARLTGIGAEIYRSESSPDVAAAIHVFPLVPVVCMFWDKDPEFEAVLQFLFDRSAPSFLDLESLAVVLEYVSVRLMKDA